MADSGRYETSRATSDPNGQAVEIFRKEMARSAPGAPGAHARQRDSGVLRPQMPLNQIATVHAPEPQMITRQPFDPPPGGN